uniref:Transposase (Putative), gypsy type n=1 Tax=Tanacetum cinerariifolium TaxID=118510 RepID=A0A6L2MUV3_TANCI|nr:hypothetical protein [Tanacetum cinerariifolium]
MSFSKRPGKNTPQCYTKPLDSLKNWNNRFFWVDKRVFPTVVDWRTSTPKDGMSAENTYSAEAVAQSPESIYRPEWGIANGSVLDTPEACQDLVDHVAPPGYFSELRHLRNDDFLRQYNVNLARQVAMGSQLQLRFEQEAKLLKKYVAQVARRDKRIQAREHEIKNLEALLEAEADMKKAAEDKSAKLSQELENMRTLFSGLQVTNDHLSQQVATLQEQVSGEEKLKAAFEEFKQYEDNRVEQRCADVTPLFVKKALSHNLGVSSKHSSET